MLAVGLFAVIAATVATSVRPRQAVAATNATLNFQARLQTNGGGIVPDGFYNIQFKLYDVSSGGTALWTESWYDTNGATAGSDNRIRVKNGYLTVNLGTHTAFPSTINWDQDLWITMNVGGMGHTATPTYDGEMDPRLKLTGVPYAFRAGQLARNSGSYTSVLELAAPTNGNQTFTIPDQGAAGNYTLLTTNTADANYIQNSTSPQNANFAIQSSAAASATTALIRQAGGQTGLLLDVQASSQTSFLNINQSGTLSVNGAAVFRNGADSTTAFQVQNAAGTNLLAVDTTTTNVISNPSFETDTAGWAVSGSSAISRTTTAANVYHGTAALQLTTTALANDGVRASSFSSTPSFATSATWNLSFYARLTSGSMSTLQAGYNLGASDTTCSLSSGTLSNSGYNRYSCTITLTSGQSISSVFIRQSDASVRTLFIDGVQLTAGSSVVPFRSGSVHIGGVISNPVTVQSGSNSTTAFQVQNTAGTGNTFVVDTLNNRVNVNSGGYSATLNVGGTQVNRTTTNSSSAFQVQNSNANPILGVSTSAPSANLITNPGFESNTTGWSNKTGGTLTRTTTSAALYMGTAAGQLALTGSGGGAAFTATLGLGTTYNFSFYARTSSGTASNISMGYTNGGGDVDCATGQTVVNGGFTRYTCSFTVSGTAGTAVYIRQSSAVTQTLYVDGFQLLASATAPVPYSLGGLQIRGTIETPVSLQNATNSTTAFQVQNASGTGNTFVVDTLNSRIGMGTNAPQYDFHMVRSGDAVLWLEADSDDTTEGDNPTIVLAQDGGLNTMKIGLNGNPDAEYVDALMNASYIENDGGDSLQLVTGNAARLTVLETGEVGIGTTAPGYDLDVNGTFRASGDAVIGNGTAGQLQLGDGYITKTSGSGFQFDSGIDSTQDISAADDLTAGGDVVSGSTRTIHADYGSGESNQWKRVAVANSNNGLVSLKGVLGGHDIDAGGQGQTWLDLGFSYRNNFKVLGTASGRMSSDSGARANVIVVSDGSTLEVYLEKADYTQYSFVMQNSGSGSSLHDDAWTSTDPRGRAGWTTEFELTDHLAAGSRQYVTFNGPATPAMHLDDGFLGVGINAPAYAVDVSGDVNVTGGYRVDGTLGTTVSCTGGQLLQDAVIAGGIFTGGSCVAAGTGAVTAVGTLDSQFKVADGAVIIGGTIYFQTADASSVGMVSTGTQTFAGNKTFNGAVTMNDDLYVVGNLRLTDRTRQYTSAYSTTIAAATPIKMGEFTFAGSFQNVILTGEIRGQTGNSIGINRFSIAARGDTVPSKSFTFSQEKEGSVDISAKLYHDAATGRVVLAYQTGTALQNVTWSVTASERENYDYYQNTTAYSVLTTTGLTEISPNATYARTMGGNLTVDGSVTAQTGASLSGGTVSINASSNFATNINTGSSTGAVTIANGASAGAVTIGGGSNTFSLNTSTIDISSGGAITGATGISMASGNFAQSGSGTFGTGTGAVSLNGDTTLASGKTLTASGTITTSADVLGRAVTASGYLTSNTSNTAVGQYTKLATCTITSQYQDCRTMAQVLAYADGNGTVRRATVDWRVKQQNAMAGVPAIDLEIFDLNSLEATDFTAVTVQNDATATVVELWGQIDNSYTAWSVSPLVNTSTKAVWHAVQGFSAALPSGAQTASTYADERLNTLNTTGSVSVGTSINITTDLQTGGTTRLDNAGALSNITGYSQTSGNFVQSGAGTFATGTGAVSLNGDVTIASGKTLTVNGSGIVTGTLQIGAITDNQGFARNITSNEWSWWGRQYAGNQGAVNLSLYTHFLDVSETPIETEYIHTNTLDANGRLEGMWTTTSTYHSIFTTHIHVNQEFSLTSEPLTGDDAHAIYIDGKLVAGSTVCCTTTNYNFTFKPGWHKIDLLYNQGGGGHYVSPGWNPKDYTAYIDAMTPFGPGDMYNTDQIAFREGNVGFGTTSPGYKVDVDGDINTADNLRTGGTIRLDASGNLSNIGSIGASGNITTTGDVAGAVLNATTAVQTGGITRIDASGNLSNIGTLTLSGPIRTAALTTGGEMIYVRGTGNNRVANRLVKVGNTTLVDTATRGLTLTILTAATHAHVSSTNYDVYGLGTEADALATAMGNMTKDQIGILSSYDAWEGQMTNNLRSQSLRLGLSKLGTYDLGGSRRPYAAIFYGAGGATNNTDKNRQVVEIMQTSEGNAPYAVVSGWLIEDGFSGSGGVSNALYSANSDTANPVVVVDSDDNVGIGTTAPRGDLDLGVDGASLVLGGYVSGANILFGSELSADSIDYENSEFGFRTDQANGFRFYTNAGDNATTPDVTIEDGGDFGIGTSNPGYKLDVQGGDINVSGIYRSGGTAGVSRTCTGGQVLQDAVTVGGIVTGGTCATVGGSGSGVTTVGTIDSQTKNANGAVISGTTIYMQSADTTYAGLVTAGTQTFGGAKTFNGVTTMADRLTLSGTITTGSSSRMNLTGTLSSSGTGSQYGIQNVMNFNPTGASLNNVYGTASDVTISGSALNIGKVVGTTTSLTTTSGYTGQIASGIGFEVGAPVVGGSQLIADYRGIFLNGFSSNGGNTSGTINNYQLRFNGITAGAGTGGTLNNYGIYVTQPSGSGTGTTNNYGLYITGAGAGSTNYAIYNTGTAPIYSQGNLQVGTTSNPSNYAVQVAGDINTTTGVYRVNGTAGVSRTCTGGQVLQDAVSINGIVTGGTCATVGGSGSGVTTVGTIDGQTKSANGAVIVGTTIHMQTADGSNPGLVSTGAQTFAGNKQFSGSLGIGTAPSYDLHISRTGDAIFRLDADSDNVSEPDNPKIVLSQDGGLTVGEIGMFGNANDGYTDSLANAMYFGHLGSEAVQLMTGNAARLTVAAGGNVGIGTNAPSQKLQVVGSVQVSDAAATASQGFEGATFVPASPGTWSTGGTTNGWVRDTTACATPPEGSACAGTGTTGNNAVSWLDVNYTFTNAGVIKFNWKVSSEDRWDYLLFCVDDDTCDRDSGVSKEMVSGESGWREVVWPVSAGAHSFRWVYSKDGGAAEGSDRGWVDNVRFIESVGSITVDSSVTTNRLQAAQGVFTQNLAIGNMTVNNTDGQQGPASELHLWGMDTLGSGATIQFGDYGNVWVREGGGDSDRLELYGSSGINIETDATIHFTTANTDSHLDDNGLAIFGSTAGEELDVEGQIQFNLDGNAGDTTIGVCKNTSDSSGVQTDTEFRDCNGTATDIAEFYPTETGVESGDIVAIGDESFTYTEEINDLLTGAYINKQKQTTVPVLRKGDRADGAKLLGIISTNPYQSLGRAIISAGANNPLPMALNGRVPVKVNDENGPIKSGDQLTASSTPGVAMKARPGDFILATAIGELDAETGRIMAFVRSGASAATDPTLVQQVASLQSELGDMGSQINTGMLRTGSLVVTGDAVIDGNLEVKGIARVGTLEISGHIISKGEAPKVELQQAAGIVDAEDAYEDAKVTISGNDTSGVLTVTIGRDPTTEQLLKLVFHKAYDKAPQVLLSPVGPESARLQAYVDNPSTTDFILGLIGQPETGKTYRFNYYVIQ